VGHAERGEEVLTVMGLFVFALACGLLLGLYLWNVLDFIVRC
jgi:hypothetical protein